MEMSGPSAPRFWWPGSLTVVPRTEPPSLRPPVLHLSFVVELLLRQKNSQGVLNCEAKSGSLLAPLPLIGTSIISDGLVHQSFCSGWVSLQEHLWVHESMGRCKGNQADRDCFGP